MIRGTCEDELDRVECTIATVVRSLYVKLHYHRYPPARGNINRRVRIMLGNCLLKLIGHETRQVIRKYGVRGKKTGRDLCKIKRAANMRNETLTTRGEARLPTRRRRLANRLPQLTL